MESIDAQRLIPEMLVSLRREDLNPRWEAAVHEAEAAMLHVNVRTERVTLSRGMHTVLMGPPGCGKTWAAAVLYRRIRDKVRSLASMTAPWATAAFIAEHAVSWKIEEDSGDSVREFYTNAKLLVIDGLGEEDPRYRGNLLGVLKARIDAGAPTIVTTRLRAAGDDGSFDSVYGAGAGVRSLLSADRGALIATLHPRS